MGPIANCDLHKAATPSTHFWEHAVGSGNAPLAELQTASLCEAESQPFDFAGGVLGTSVTLPPPSVAAITFEFKGTGRD